MIIDRGRDQCSVPASYLFLSKIVTVVKGIRASGCYFCFHFGNFVNKERPYSGSLPSYMMLSSP